MASSADVLHYTTLTEAINEQKAPNNFLKNRFFGRDITVPTRHIELSYTRRGRLIAPFVKRNGAAIMTVGRAESFANVEPPHIRIKRPMSPSDLMVNRRPGGVIFASGEDIGSAMRQYMADEMEMMLDDVTNSEEYLSALAIRGSITYAAQDEATFTVVSPRTATHDFALAGADRWDQTNSSPRKTFKTVMQLVNEDVGLGVTDVVMGADAAEAFLSNPESNTLLDVRRFNTGTLDFNQQFQQDGALFLGTYVGGIMIWMYPRQVSVGSTAVDLVRSKYAEFIARTPAAQFVTYYGAIEDMKAIGPGKVLQSKRFSKSWEEEDPSARMLLVESNPLPVMRRPDASCSVQVIS